MATWVMVLALFDRRCLEHVRGSIDTIVLAACCTPQVVKCFKCSLNLLHPTGHRLETIGTYCACAVKRPQVHLATRTSIRWVFFC